MTKAAEDANIVLESLIQAASGWSVPVASIQPSSLLVLIIILRCNLARSGFVWPVRSLACRSIDLTSDSSQAVTSIFLL